MQINTREVFRQVHLLLIQSASGKTVVGILPYLAEFVCR